MIRRSPSSRWLRLRIRLGRRFYRWAKALYGLQMVSNGLDLIHCVHCGVDIEEDDHPEDCPSVTGVYPVTPRDCWPAGMLCDRCDTEFWPGDFYSLIQVGSEYDQATSPPVYEVACTGCAVLAGVAE